MIVAAILSQQFESPLNPRSQRHLVRRSMGSSSIQKTAKRAGPPPIRPQLGWTVGCRRSPVGEPGGTCRGEEGGQAPAVRAFARLMVLDHMELESQLTGLAAENGTRGLETIAKPIQTLE